MPKHGSIATYTSAWAKYQNNRCHNTGRLPCRTRFCGCPARNEAKEKNCEPDMRSESSAVQPASNTLKINMLSRAFRNHAQTVMGSRVKLIPSARKSIVVVAKLSALSNAASENKEALASHK